jgi:hypothetical protein
MKKLLISLLKKAGYIVYSTKAIKNQQVEVINKGKAIIQKISPDFSILNGPFKGMKYPSIDITELTLAPKITGSYEGHLTPLIYKIIDSPYDNIIDVGCAEGYYAVGLAKKIPQSVVHCFDINEFDLNFCKQMAHVNNASNLTFNKFCYPETLINFKYGKRTLIFCDCEGYEIELFTGEVIAALKNTDVLIELHDVFNPMISSTLIKRFEKTHHVEVLNNSDVEYASLKGLEHITAAEKAFAVYEHRGGLYQNIFMEWAFFTPKKYADDATN